MRYEVSSDGGGPRRVAAPPAARFDGDEAPVLTCPLTGRRVPVCVLSATRIIPKKYLLTILNQRPPSVSSEPATPEPQTDHTAALPDELLLEVFQHVDHVELVRSAQHVNDRWRQLAQDESLWRDYEYAPPQGTPTSDMTAVLRQSPHLRAFTLPPGADANAALDALSNRCHELRRLNLEVAARINIRVLKSLFTRIPALEQLQLSQRPRVDGGVYKRLALRFRPPKPEPSDMSYFYESLTSPAYRSQTFMFISKFVIRSRKSDIEQLRLNFVSDEMLEVVQQCSGLEKLRLEFDQYQDTLKTNLQFVRDFPKLKSLELVSYHNDEVLNEIFKKGPWPELKELNLGYSTGLSDRTLKTIQANCPNLEKVVLECCLNVTDKGIQNLTKNVDLRHVKMSSCPLLSAESVRLVTRSKKVQHLDLTNFLGPVADYLPHLISHSQLRFLSLKGCIITRQDINAVLHHLKHTKVLVDPPKKDKVRTPSVS